MLSFIEDFCISIFIYLFKESLGNVADWTVLMRSLTLVDTSLPESPVNPTYARDLVEVQFDNN